MDDPNITIEESIRLEEEKAPRHGRTFNWQNATFGKVKYYEDEDDCFADFETTFPAIVFDNTSTSDTAPPCEPTVSPPNKNKIDFKISLDESDDEDYTIIFDENSFSYKIIYVNDLKTDSKSDNGKNNMPSSPKPTSDYLDDLDCFNDFENEFPAIVYNDGLTSKSDLLIEPPDNNDNIDITQPSGDMAPLPHRDLRHPWLRYQVDGYDEGTIHSYEQRLETIWGRPVNRVHVLDFVGLTEGMRQTLRDRREKDDIEAVYSGIGAYWADSERVITDKGDLRDYWIEILSDRDFLGPDPSYVHIKDLVRRLCHRMIACSISGKGQGAEKVRRYVGLVASGLERQQAAAAGAPAAVESAHAVDEGAQGVPAPAQAP
ncbi:hypothetical protein Tco_0856644 [Tanacetum coccineum]|uniref:Uncharacterized protein n=1 Tax=Tanacetum coccineum TaxID=301880 RepID=A0ABQ5B619_9ASTR